MSYKGMITKQKYQEYWLLKRFITRQRKEAGRYAFESYINPLGLTRLTREYEQYEDTRETIIDLPRQGRGHFDYAYMVRVVFPRNYTRNMAEDYFYYGHEPEDAISHTTMTIPEKHTFVKRGENWVLFYRVYRKRKIEANPYALTDTVYLDHRDEKPELGIVGVPYGR